MKRKVYFCFRFDGSQNDCENFRKLGLNKALKMAWEATCGRSKKAIGYRNEILAADFKEMKKEALAAFEFMADYPITIDDIVDFVYGWTVSNAYDTSNECYGVEL